MPYSKRIETLCSLLVPAKTFADVGCDHGYCTEYMLKNGLCEYAVFSDISRGSLEKAEKLLRGYVQDGRAKPVLGDGFLGVPKDTEEVLIAGMGGSEIVGILSDSVHGFLPRRFVFQPMHDAEKLRRYLVENGAYIERDYTFEDKKFYEVLVGGYDATRSENYSEAEYEFGRDNLRERGEAFLRRMQTLYENLGTYMQSEGLAKESLSALQARRNKLKGVLLGEIK